MKLLALLKAATQKLAAAACTAWPGAAEGTHTLCYSPCCSAERLHSPALPRAVKPYESTTLPSASRKLHINFILISLEFVVYLGRTRKNTTEKKNKTTTRKKKHHNTQKEKPKQTKSKNQQPKPTIQFPPSGLRYIHIISCSGSNLVGLSHSVKSTNS